VTVDAGRFPSDERWRGFWLVSEATGQNVEMVWLHKGEAARVDGPIGLVERGFLADAWIRASQQGWDRTAMLGLLAVIWPKMRTLLEEIREAKPDPLRAAIRECLNELDARQVGVREAWMEECGKDGLSGV
jgi:hypothetical protein